MNASDFIVTPIGFVRSALTEREAAPLQGDESAPAAWLELDPLVAEGLVGIGEGDEVIVLTWLHQARRDLLQVHPRGQLERPLSGVFTTRSPDRPNPIGLHRVVILAVVGTRLHVQPLEAIDGTPILDLKPVLGEIDSR